MLATADFPLPTSPLLHTFSQSFIPQVSLTHTNTHRHRNYFQIKHRTRNFLVALQFNQFNHPSINPCMPSQAQIQPKTKIKPIPNCQSNPTQSNPSRISSHLICTNPELQSAGDKNKLLTLACFLPSLLAHIRPPIQQPIGKPNKIHRNPSCQIPRI